MQLINQIAQILERNSFRYRTVFYPHFAWKSNGIITKEKSAYLRTWFVQTMTGCWLFSMLSLTCRTQCTHNQSPDRRWSRNSKMHDRSCSDCVTEIENSPSGYKLKLISTKHYHHYSSRSNLCEGPWRHSILLVPVTFRFRGNPYGRSYCACLERKTES
jgi:hypothetical protein